MERVEKLCAYLGECKVFADVGCDHGYCTQYMLENGLCGRAVISDISAKCLKKAEKLLEKYIACGRVTSVCCNGLEKVDRAADLVLIAGMGGEEIAAILRNASVPENFVLQPMKNARAVREFLLEAGAAIAVDEVFESGGKYYRVIKGSRSGEGREYTENQLDYGLDFESEAARGYLYGEYQKKLSYLERPLSGEARAKILAEAKILGGILR